MKKFEFWNALEGLFLFGFAFIWSSLYHAGVKEVKIEYNLKNYM